MTKDNAAQVQKLYQALGNANNQSRVSVAMVTHGQSLRVRLANGRVLTGLARGLDRDGGLQLETRAGLRAVQSGRVLSARPA